MLERQSRRASHAGTFAPCRRDLIGEEDRGYERTTLRPHPFAVISKTRRRPSAVFEAL
jgi:hypothetical protein